MIECISAVTLDMARALHFYKALGFELTHGGEDAAFSSLRAGKGYLMNLTIRSDGRHQGWWGRMIFYVSDVDALHACVIAAGYHPDTALRDPEWGECFFHVTDPDAHELSFARPLR